MPYSVPPIAAVEVGGHSVVIIGFRQVKIASVNVRKGPLEQHAPITSEASLNV